MLRLAVSGKSLVQRAMFHSVSKASKAEAFLMPAMSPTMEQGGIVEWKRKVGEEFSAGDVLLEVETDKATIEVEAQDDGKLAKIIQDNGAKNIKVGETIAFVADVDDALDSLELPTTTTASAPTAPAPTAPAEKKKLQPAETKQHAPKSAGFVVVKADPSQTFLPSVQTLLHENGISRTDALNKISPTGRGGRILKGDVLGFLGKIPIDAAQNIANYVSRFEKLDLSNIEKRVLTTDDKTATTEVAAGTKEPNDGSPSNDTPLRKEKVPIVMKEDIEFVTPAHVTHEELSQAIKTFMEQAKAGAHGYKDMNTHSDLYDPIFEDLITEEPLKPRFSLEYNLVNKDGSATHPRYRNTRDIFDLLSTPVPTDAADNVTKPEHTHDYILRVSVHVNEQYTDSVAKAKAFLESVKDLALFQ